MKKLLLTFILLFTTALFGEETVWKSDLSHSNALFTVSHMVISEVTGRFTDFDATLVQKGADLTSGSVTMIVKTSSINTDNEGRDKHLRSDDFFNSEKFPEAKFISASIEKSGEGIYAIKGSITIRDITKPITLMAKYNGTMKDPWGNEKAGFKVTGTINRMEFGLKWNKVLEAGGFVVGENVDLIFQLEMTKEKKEAGTK